MSDAAVARFSHEDAMNLGCRCTDCPLFEDSTPVPPFRGKHTTKMIICGEAPGRDEEREGRFFVGASGKLLGRAIDRFGIQTSKLHLTNAVLCRPQGALFNPNPDQWRQAVAACKPRLERELSQTKCDFVLAYGKWALYGFTGKYKTFDWAGAVLDGENSRRVFATQHPAFALRPDGRGYLPSFFTHTQRAWLLANNHLPKWEWPEEVLDPTERAVEVLESILRDKCRVGFDVETQGTDPFNSPLMCLAIARREASVCLPWAAYFAKGGEFVPALTDYPLGSKLRSLVLRILADPKVPKVMQNGQHDILSMEQLGAPVHNYSGDTLLKHALVYPRMKHDLGWIGATELWAPRWKSEFRVTTDAKGLDAFVKRHPLDLRRYCSRDAWGTLMSDESLDARLELMHRGVELSDAYLRRAKIALMMNRRGVPVDVSRFANHRKKLGRKRSQAARDLWWVARDFGYVRWKDNPRWRELKRCFKRCKRRKRLSKDERRALRGLRRECREYEKSTKGKHFNPNSQPFLRDLFFNKLKVVPRRFSEKTDKPKLDESILEDLVTHSNEIVALSARCVLRFRRWNKLRSTYIDGLPLDQHNVVHVTWNVHGAKTFRFSSSPNLQNIPKPAFKTLANGKKKLVSPGLRDLFTGFPGNWLVERDYSQLELRIIAWLSGDEKLLDWYARGYDVHRMKAAELFNKRHEDVSKEERNFTKTFNYAVMYLAEPETIYANMVIDFPATSLLYVRKMRELWIRQHPAVMRYQERKLKFARKNDYVEAPVSGHRMLCYGKPDPTVIANADVQHTGADIINAAFEKVSEALRWPDEGILMQVHDALICDGPNPIRLSRVLQQHMDTTLELNGRRMHFPTDVKVSPCSWGEAEEFDDEKELRAGIARWRREGLAPKNTKANAKLRRQMIVGGNNSKLWS